MSIENPEKEVWLDIENLKKAIDWYEHYGFADLNGCLDRVSEALEKGEDPNINDVGQLVVEVMMFYGVCNHHEPSNKIYDQLGGAAAIGRRWLKEAAEGQQKIRKWDRGLVMKMIERNNLLY